MRAKKFIVYPSLNIRVPEIPKRSLLYPLKPLGIGTPACENFLSYIKRLAYEHSVNFNYFFKKILLQRDLYSCDNIVSQARVINILKVMTNLDSLDCLIMRDWLGSIEYQDLYTYYQGWCPVCLEEWRASKKIIYYPIIWSFRCINFCCFHYFPLEYKCSKCEQKISFKTKRFNLPLGYCDFCGNWLGRSFSESTLLKYTQEHQNSLFRQYLVENLSQLIATKNDSNSELHKGKAGAILGILIHEESINRIEKHLIPSFLKTLIKYGVTREFIDSFFMYNIADSRIEDLLGLGYCLNVSVIQLMTQELEQLIPMFKPRYF